MAKRNEGTFLDMATALKEAAAELNETERESAALCSAPDAEVLQQAERGDVPACWETAYRLIAAGKLQEAVAWAERLTAYGDTLGGELLIELFMRPEVDAEPERRIYGVLLAEQTGSSRAADMMQDLARSKDEEERGLLYDAEDRLFRFRIGEAAQEAYARRAWPAALVRLVPADKKEFGKGAYLLSATFADELSKSGAPGERYEEAGDLAVVYSRDKREKEPAFLARVGARVETAARNVLAAFPASKLLVDVCGSTRETALQPAGGGSDGQKAEAKAKFYAGDAAPDETVGQAEKLRVAVVKQELLERGSCPQCGGELTVTEGGLVCARCGKVVSGEAPKPLSGAEIRLSEGAAEEAAHLVRCKQCGGAIPLGEAAAGYVVCPNCGSSYLLNQKVLRQIASGLDRQNMQQMKPAGATVPDVSFTARRILGGKLDIAMPVSFQVMDEKIKAAKYNRGNPPEVVYTDEAGTVNLCLTVQYAKALADADVPHAGREIEKAVRAMMPSATFDESRDIEVNGRTVHYFNCITAAADQDVYNLMFYFSLEGKLCMGSWNCLAKDRWFWAPVFRLMLNSISSAQE